MCPFQRASSLHCILPVNNPRPQLESKCQGFNHNAVGYESSLPILTARNNKTCIWKQPLYVITDIQLVSFVYLCFPVSILTNTLIYTHQKRCSVVSLNSPFSFSQYQRQFILVWQKQDKVFQQISILTVHRSERDGALLRVFTRVSGSVTKDVFHAPSSFHLNLLLLDRFFYQHVS